MKFKKDPQTVWLFVRAVLALLIARIALFLKPGMKAPRTLVRITVHGHQLSGSLAVFMHWLRLKDMPFECKYLSIDNTYLNELKDDGYSVCSAQSVSDMMWVLSSDVFMTDHGPGIYKLMKLVQPRIRFVDVWHGIGFKGFEDNEIAKGFKRYDRVFCSSTWVKENLYVRQGLNESRIVPTGCATSDKLLSEEPERSKLFKVFELPENGKHIVLYAPTWSHGSIESKSGLQVADVIDVLEELASNQDTICVVRLHINSSTGACQKTSRIHYRPMLDFPDTLSLMRASDVLITDWSSIATDYLVLNRPAVFIDTPDPFAGSHLLTPEDRVGQVVRSSEELTNSLMQALRDPECYLKGHREKRTKTLDRAYGNTLDGNSCERYATAIITMLGDRKCLNHNGSS